jgi:hypothetical protein
LILLDENTLRGQFELLDARRLPVRKVGRDWGRQGMSDEEILTALCGMRHVTFFTSDADFYRYAYCHPGYCLVLVAAPAREFAEYVSRFLRHRAFRTHATRMGKVIRLQPAGIVYWTRNSTHETELSWR